MYEEGRGSARRNSPRASYQTLRGSHLTWSYRGSLLCGAEPRGSFEEMRRHIQQVCSAKVGRLRGRKVYQKHLILGCHFVPSSNILAAQPSKDCVRLRGYHNSFYSYKNFNLSLLKRCTRSTQMLKSCYTNCNSCVSHLMLIIILGAAPAVGPYRGSSP